MSKHQSFSMPYKTGVTQRYRATRMCMFLNTCFNSNLTFENPTRWSVFNYESDGDLDILILTATKRPNSVGLPQHDEITFHLVNVY